MSDARLPPLPTLRALTAWLRQLNQAFSHPGGGGEYVSLFCEAPFFPSTGGWRVAVTPTEYLTIAVVEHREWVPGDCYPEGLDAALLADVREGVRSHSKWDATAAARRLLAAARDAVAGDI